MKQFNLNEYLKKPSRKVVTRDGRPVRILCTDAKSDYPVIGLISSNGGDYPENYTDAKHFPAMLCKKSLTKS